MCLNLWLLFIFFQLPGSSGSISDMMGQIGDYEEEDRLKDKFDILLSTLGVRLPPSVGEENEDRPEDLKTPTSSEAAAVLQCPPPPRKPKRLPSMKRKARGRSIVMPHNLFVEMELMFPPHDLLGGKVVKKVKRPAE